MFASILIFLHPRLLSISFSALKGRSWGQSAEHYLLSTGEEPVGLWETSSLFPLRRDLPCSQDEDTNHRPEDGRVGLPVGRLCIPTACRRPHMFRVGDFASSAHFSRESRRTCTASVQVLVNGVCLSVCRPQRLVAPNVGVVFAPGEDLKLVVRCTCLARR